LEFEILEKKQEKLINLLMKSMKDSKSMLKYENLLIKEIEIETVGESRLKSGFSLLDIDPMDLAQQIALMSFNSFKTLKMTEVFNWGVKYPKFQIIEQFNKMVNWVVQTILSKEKLKERVKILDYFLTVLSNLFEIGDFNMCMAMSSSLMNSSIHRLKHTWEMADSQLMKKYEFIENQFSHASGYIKYRNLVNERLPPLIPYLSVYLTNLIFIEDGNPSFIGKTNCLNWKKFNKKCDILHQIDSYQCVGFSFKTLPEIQQFQEVDLQSDEKELFGKSLLLEPRNSNKNEIQ
jgi:son of sevenless